MSKKGQFCRIIYSVIFLIFFTTQIYGKETTGEMFPKIFQSVVLIKNETFLNDSALKPWMRETIGTGYGTGIVIGKNQIITNAHVVMDSKFLTVQHYNKKKKYRAKIKYLAIDCDLALIEVDEEEDFNENVQVFPFSKTYPNLGSELLVLGYPNGTENLTVEKGNVLSIEKNRYTFSGLDFRNVIKVKSAVVPGNSGGPAIQGDSIVGIVFQISQTEREISYLIPTDIIRHFLKDIEDGKYNGFPNLGFTFQLGEHSSLKEKYKVPPNQKGVFVNTVYPGSSFFNYLKEMDFVYKVDDYYINNNGELILDERESLIDYIEKKYVDDPVTFYFYRNGQNYKASSNLKLTKSLELYREDNISYFLNSGLVFQPVSKAFFANINPNNMDSSAKYHFSYFIQDKLYRFNDRDVILSYIFEDPENFRYHKYKYKVVETINYHSPKDLDHFIELWQRFHNETILIKFRGVDLPIVITPEEREKINIRVRKRFGAVNDKP